MADDGGYGDVEEEESGDELGDEGPIEGPELELVRVKERSWRWVDVVLPMVAGLSLLNYFLRHFHKQVQNSQKWLGFFGGMKKALEVLGD